MLPYPFSYFSSIFPFKASFKNRKVLTWFQIIFTSLFLISLSLIPVALQNASRTSYPLETFIDKVYEPLDGQVMQDIRENIQIKEGQLSYNGQNPIHKNQAGQVLLGQDSQSLGQDLTLTFGPNQLLISKQKKELARIYYRQIKQADLKDKASLSKAISQAWFQENRIIINLFILLISAGLFTLNFLILTVGASFFLYLTKKSRLFAFRTIKECYNFTLNCLGLASIISLICGLFGQALPTMITIQNILFVLYLVLVFYQTHFQDSDN
ncbi:DUF1189 family protein [Streptococcus oricebi]|uniref:DUF1189 domain-containing protein n=1 Tax=Streptococcus oricebi TaxID=1547447 RepID=A0ABS5B525_9STRE|nr:DUF1189 family protein [Streptococcus oricebi]MBP2623910.1 DUF1189 domain-containing protein [Streptococcus oricebi]